MSIQKLRHKTPKKEKLHLLLMKTSGKVKSFSFRPQFLTYFILLLLLMAAGTVWAVFATKNYMQLDIRCASLEAENAALSAKLKQLEGNLGYAESFIDTILPNEGGTKTAGITKPLETGADAAADQAEGGQEAGEPAVEGQIDAAPADGQSAPDAAPETANDDGQNDGQSVEGEGQTAADALAAPGDNPLAALTASMSEAPEPEVEAVDFRIKDNGKFDFTIKKISQANQLVQGNILVVGLIAAQNGAISLASLEGVDLGGAELDFKRGPGYSIRVSKTIEGTIKAPAGAKVLEALILAKSDDGLIVLKKLIKIEN